MPFRNPYAGSVRVRLLIIALLPMLVLLPMFLGLTMLRWSGKIDNLLIVKVNGDLTIADQYLGRLLENSGERIAALGGSVRFATEMAGPDAAGFLAKQQADLGLDYLLVLADGDTGPRAQAMNPDKWPVIAAALAGRQSSAVDVVDASTLTAIDPSLAPRAIVPLVPTEAAVPTDRQAEDRGMVVHSAAPVTLPDGRHAALVGGILLNRNLGFIDTINDLVYRDRSLPEGSKGTATLFLDDVRISTNVRLFENVRALGTRVSAAVRGRVLDEGQVWLNRAFVVNDWYISAYEPIVDSHGTRVGMLYVGFLETPFATAKMNSVITVMLVFLITTILSVPIFLRWAGRIFGPLEVMTHTIAQVEAGNLDARIGGTEGRDEISRVAGHLDSLLDQVQERDRQLRDWADALNVKVEDRTRDLMEANQKLERTTEQLILSEKLAAVGEITASAAHEINNPVAVIQGNLDVARQLLGPAAAEVKTEFDLIDGQVHRINVIISKLLQFARPSEYSGSSDRLSPQDVVDDCLTLTRHQIEQHGIRVIRSFDATGQVFIERTELQQVLINLILNASHAMREGGTLTLATRDLEQGGIPGVETSASDTGTGIAADAIGRIFEPFFTTKRSEGTGLGLAICQTLVNRAGGAMAVTSVPGQGSRFTVWLPTAL